MDIMATIRDMEMVKKRRASLWLFLLSLCILLAGCGSEEKKAAETEENLSETEESDDSDTIIWQGVRYRYNDHLSNFLFLGIDTKEQTLTEMGEADAGQSDALFLLSWDRKEDQVTLISIPRDTMTPIEVFDRNGGSLGLTENHISLAYAYGDGSYKSLELSKQAVSSLLYGMPIQGVCAMSLDGIPELLKSFGNVTVTVPNDSLSEAYPEFQEGQEAVITPENAEVFLRSRDTAVSQSAISRMERQQAFLDALGSAAAKEPKKMVKLYEDLQPYIVSSISNDWFLKLIEALSGKEGVKRWTIPGQGVEGELFDEYRIDEDALYEKVIETFYEKAE